MYEIKNHSVVYNGKIIDVYKDEVVLENNKVATREIVFHGGAAAILPIDKDGNIIFVKQYRHSAKKIVIEIPAGTLEKNEDPKLCAIRELEEETAYRTNKITFLTKIYAAIGYSTEIIYIYLAEDLEEGKLNLDEDEFVERVKYSLKESIELIFNGEIVDSKTIVAVLMYSNILNSK